MRYLNALQLFSMIIVFFCPCIISQVNLEWVSRYSGLLDGYDGALSVTVDDSGYIYTTGGTQNVNVGNDFDYITIKYTPFGDSVWVKRFNGPENGFDVARDLAVDDSGNVYVTGTSVMGTLKYDKSGNEVWFRRFGQFSAGYKIQIDQNRYIYVAGESNFDYALVKFDTDGNLIWSKTYNGPANNNDIIRDLVIDNRANIVVTGGSKVIGNDWDIATIKYDGGTGDALWIRRYEGLSSYSFNEGYGITSDDSNNIYITGWSDGINGTPQCITIKYSSDGDLLWERRFPADGNIGYAGYDIINDPSGFVYVAARANGYEDVLIKYDYDGNLVWSAHYKASHFFATNQPRLVLDKFRNVYMSSVNSDSLYTYFVVLKYIPDGNREWEYRYYYPPVTGTFSVNNAYDLFVDSSLNVYVTGESIVSGLGTDFDILTIKLSQDSTTFVQDTNIFPSEFQLFPAYPNPFNSITNISFTLPYSSEVDMKIYNILGEEITTLISGSYLASTHTVQWDAGDLPSGMYLCRLQAENEQRVIKLLLVR
jgi:hypothetical protein